MSQLQVQQMMTSQIRSHIEYLIHTNNILVLILYSKLTRNVAAMAIFNTIDLMMILDSGLLFWPPCIYTEQNYCNTATQHENSVHRSGCSAEHAEHA